MPARQTRCRHKVSGRHTRDCKMLCRYSALYSRQDRDQSPPNETNPRRKPKPKPKIKSKQTENQNPTQVQPAQPKSTRLALHRCRNQSVLRPNALLPKNPLSDVCAGKTKNRNKKNDLPPSCSLYSYTSVVDDLWAAHCRHVAPVSARTRMLSQFWLGYFWQRCL